MNISGIRMRTEFIDYNSISNAEAVSTKGQVESEQQDSVSEASAAEQSAGLISQSNQTFGAYDYAQQYNPDESYDMKGSESSIYDLDIQHVISGMQKDDVLQQYQYFVGDMKQSGSAQQSKSAMLENFSL